jgi:hypothetical protein
VNSAYTSSKGEKLITLPAFAELKFHDSLDCISAISYKDPCREIAICSENPLGTCFSQVDTKSSGAYFQFTPRLKKRSLYYFDNAWRGVGLSKRYETHALSTKIQLAARELSSL